MTTVNIEKEITNGKYGDTSYFKSERQDYMTPPAIYQPILDFIEKEKFNCDVCCTVMNIPANIYYSEKGIYSPFHIMFEKENGLTGSWVRTCWMNPPFNKTDKWVKKAVSEVEKNNCEVWAVFPARTETKYWQEYILNNPDCFVVFLRKGFGFIDPETMKIIGQYKNPLAIVYFGKNAKEYAQRWKVEMPINGGVYYSL